MKGTELMLGDWVLQNGRAKKVLVIWGNKMVSLNDPIKDWGSIYADKFECTDIEPIPLTKEILKKNGWKCGCYPYDDIYTHPEVGFSIERESTTNDVYHVSLGFEKHIFAIRYIHELQHTLLLAGVKNEIEP